MGLSWCGDLWIFHRKYTIWVRVGSGGVINTFSVSSIYPAWYISRVYAFTRAARSGVGSVSSFLYVDASLRKLLPS